MLYREYGTTGKRVSLIGLGTSRLQGEEKSLPASVDLILRAIELGINYFDTAPTYASGASERILGTAFEQVSGKKLFIASKSMLSMDPTADDVLRRVDSALSTLHVSKIDFFHMWSVLTLEQYRKIMAPGGPYEGALRAKEQGLIDRICFSAHCNGAELAQILNEGGFDGVTLGFNALNYRHRLDGLHLANERGMGVAIMNPLGGGLIPRNPEYFAALKGSGESVAEGAIRFVAAHREVSTLLIGVNNERDLLEAVRTIEEPDPLTAEQWHAVADQMNDPNEPLCTMCDYCKGCPKGLPISHLMGSYNEYILTNKNEKHFHDWRKMFYGAYPFETVDCIKCGRCESVCTQHLPIIRRIEAINEICGREADKQKELLERFFPATGYPKTAIYGLSIDAETMLRASEMLSGRMPENVLFFDSNPAKWGTQVLDSEMTVYPPEKLQTLGIERVIITARKYEQEIRSMLKDYVREGTEIDAL
jgi:hypothetical protein